MSVPTGSPFSCMHAEYVPNYRKQESETETDTEKSKHVRLIKKGGLVGIVLDARVAGDWISVFKLNAHAKMQENLIQVSSPSSSSSSVMSPSSTFIHNRSILVPVMSQLSNNQFLILSNLVILSYLGSFWCLVLCTIL